ncbi:MAG: serine hydrolase, partial [Candidatus Thorarchaeota archaeon]
MMCSITTIRRSTFSLLIVTMILFTFPLLSSRYEYTFDNDFEKLNQVEGFSQDYWPTNDWLNGTPEDFGMQSSKLQDMLDYIDNQSIPMEYLIVVKDGYITFQHYFHWLFEPDKRLDVYTIVRLLTGTLFGMALDEGLIDNATRPVVDFFPDFTIANLTPWKESITIEHLLTYTSGFDWDEHSVLYGDPENSYTQMQASDNWAGYILNLTVLHEPGTHWNYGGGDSHLLSCIFTKETGMSLCDYAIENLFTPLNITNFVWGSETTGLSNGANALRMAPHDLAKLGFLMINNGTWDSEQ